MANFSLKLSTPHFFLSFIPQKFPPSTQIKDMDFREFSWENTILKNKKPTA